MSSSKKWYLSKTIWAGIVTVVINTYYLVVEYILVPQGIVLPYIPDNVITALDILLGGIVYYGRKTATKEIER